MIRLISTLAFVLGATAVIWMAATFVHSNALALAVTGVIGLGYLLGFWELRQFRLATDSLAKAMDGLKQPPESVDAWLAQIDDNLRQSVALRIAGERVALPAPVLTPYLVGLLVMLGLLGTFVGMVETLQGAVVALQGSSELQAIRAGLAAPIEGLGLAFGTSVAGVAASAMLGLVSTLSRRERLHQAQRLEQLLSGHLEVFTHHHQRQQTYQALQQQSDALPNVAQQLSDVASQLADLGGQISQQVAQSQDQLLTMTQERYNAMSDVVTQKMSEAIAQMQTLSSDATSRTVETLQPLLKVNSDQIKHGLLDDANRRGEQLQQLCQQQLAAMQNQLEQTAAHQRDMVTQSLTQQQQLLNESSDLHNQQVSALGEAFAKHLKALKDQQSQGWDSFAKQQQQSDEQRQQTWQALLAQQHGDYNQQLASIAQSMQQQLQLLSATQQQHIDTVAAQMGAITQGATEHWQQQQAGNAQWFQRFQQSLNDSAEQAANARAEQAAAMEHHGMRLLSAAESLLAERRQAEQQWLQEAQQRAENLSELLVQKLSDLAISQQQLQERSSEQLGQLNAHAAEQLSALGHALEAPMTRLIATASETPKAAAQVITELRSEISKNMARDNAMLEERRALMEQLNSIASTFAESSEQQRGALAQVVENSAGTLSTLAQQFAAQIDRESARLADVGADVAAGIDQAASLTEGFSAAVDVFGQSNQQLVDTLQTLEANLLQVSNRSDEQLGYYVAQAREVIDHSVQSQTQMLEQLREIGKQQTLFADENE